MATNYDFRVLINTVNGTDISYGTSSFVSIQPNTSLIVNTDTMVDKINTMKSINVFNGKTFTTSSALFNEIGSTQFSGSTGIDTNYQYLSASIKGNKQSGSILFHANDTPTAGGDFIKRYKFFGNKVCNVLGVPENYWIYADKFRLTNTGSEQNYVSGDVLAQSLHLRDNFAISNAGAIESDLPMKHAKDTDRWIKWTDVSSSIPQNDMLIGYSNQSNEYMIRMQNNKNLIISSSRITASGDFKVEGSGITIHNGNQDGVLKIKRFTSDIGQLSAANTRLTLRALNGKNLSLEDDAGNVGVFVKDGGKVGIGADTTPTKALQVTGEISSSGGVTTTGTTTTTAAVIGAGGLTFGSADSNGIRFLNPLQEKFSIVNPANHNEEYFTLTRNGGTVISNDLVVENNITSSETILGKRYELDGGNLTLASKLGNVLHIGKSNQSILVTGGTQFGNTITASAARGGISASTGVITSHITASGQISASGTSTHDFGGTIKVGTIRPTTIISTGNSTFGNDASSDRHIFNGHITASGDISASGDLHLEGTASIGVGDLMFIHADSSDSHIVARNNQFLLRTNRAQDRIKFQPNNTDVMIVSASGNVAIGTTSPVSPFHIHKEMTDNADNSLMTIQGDLAAGDLGTEKVLIDFTMTDNNQNNYPQVKIGAAVGQNGDANSFAKEGSGAFVVYTSPGSSNIDGEDNTEERMRVDYLGNVGIGTQSPSKKLHINNSGILIDGGSAIESDAHAGTARFIIDTGGSVAHSLMDLRTDSGSLLRVNGLDNPNSFVRVGIGNDTPTKELTVAGDISASGNFHGLNGTLTLGGNISGSATSTGSFGTVAMSGNFFGHLPSVFRVGGDAFSDSRFLSFGLEDDDFEETANISSLNMGNVLVMPHDGYIDSVFLRARSGVTDLRLIFHKVSDGTDYDEVDNTSNFFGSGKRTSLVAHTGLKTNFGTTYAFVEGDVIALKCDPRGDTIDELIGMVTLMFNYS